MRSVGLAVRGRTDGGCGAGGTIGDNGDLSKLDMTWGSTPSSPMSPMNPTYPMIWSSVSKTRHDEWKITSQYRDLTLMNSIHLVKGAGRTKNFIESAVDCSNDVKKAQCLSEDFLIKM